MESKRWRPRDGVQEIASKRWRPKDGVQEMASKRWRPLDGVQEMASKRWSPRDRVQGPRDRVQEIESISKVVCVCVSVYSTLLTCQLASLAHSLPSKLPAALSQSMSMLRQLRPKIPWTQHGCMARWFLLFSKRKS